MFETYLKNCNSYIIILNCFSKSVQGCKNVKMYNKEKRSELSVEQ